jgi:hypothetical protein
MASIVARSDAALSKLYDLTASKLYGLERAMLGNGADAEEVVSDVYVQVRSIASTTVSRPEEDGRQDHTDADHHDRAQAHGHRGAQQLEVAGDVLPQLLNVVAQVADLMTDFLTQQIHVLPEQ